jgi:hypothetical protein
VMRISFAPYALSMANMVLICLRFVSDLII